MPETVLKLDERDNAVVALVTLEAGTVVQLGSASSPSSCTVAQTIPAKHKMALTTLNPGDLVYLYGMVVAEAVEAIERGGLLTTRNVRHRAGAYSAVRRPAKTVAPDASSWAERGFLGYHRADGQVGTRNYWLVLPLVFCENRNVAVLKQAFEEELGFAAPQIYRRQVAELAQLYREGKREGLKARVESGMAVEA